MQAKLVATATTGDRDRYGAPIPPKKQNIRPADFREAKAGRHQLGKL